MKNESLSTETNLPCGCCILPIVTKKEESHIYYDPCALHNAAPDLLAAAKAVLAILEDEEIAPISSILNVKDEIRAAIGKAENQNES